jgi:hypothetical protein
MRGRLAALLFALTGLVFFKPSLLGFLSWGRRHAPPPLRKRRFLSLPSTRRLRRWGQLAFHTSLLGPALGCQVGGGDVPIGSDVPSVFYVSPAGDDAGPGTLERPWKTLRYATEQLKAGETLLLADGQYRLDGSGLLSVDCDGRPRRGRPGAPITVRAEHERGALLVGDGAAEPLELWNCSDWVIEGLVLLSAHDPNVPEGTDVGSVAMLRGGSDLTLRRLILARPNRERHSHVLRVLEAERVLVEECEVYDFYHNAFEAVRTRDVALRRNYFHSRWASSSGNTVGVDDVTRGEVAIQVEESQSGLLENNVAEVVGTGFSVVGRAVGSSYTDPAPYPVSGARLYGNLARDALREGFRIETRCDAATPCDLPERIVSDTLIVNGVVLQAGTGFSVDAAPSTRVDNVTAVDVQDGLQLKREPSNAGIEFSASAARSLVRGYSGVAFSAAGVGDWSFGQCAAQVPGTEAVDFSPHDDNVLLPITVPAEDTCVAYLAPSSHLRGAAGVEGDVGANVVYRYVGGVLTAEPLWQEETGAFTCGAVVPGINDDPSQSCIGVHERLRIGAAGCPLPP